MHAVSKRRLTALAVVVGLVLVAALAAWIALGGVIAGDEGPRHRIDRDISYSLVESLRQG
jgi:hypothetical protein